MSTWRGSGPLAAQLPSSRAGAGDTSKTPPSVRLPFTTTLSLAAAPISKIFVQLAESVRGASVPPVTQTAAVVATLFWPFSVPNSRYRNFRPLYFRNLRSYTGGMKTRIGAPLWSVALALAAALPLAAQTRQPGEHHNAAPWRAWFPTASRSEPLVSLSSVRAVQDARGNVLGWFFRSDQVDPAIRGKRGEIGMLVGVSTNGAILGVQVAAHREDAKWFNLIRAPFYASFTGCSVPGEGRRPDAVSGATVSSAAMIKDVFASSRTVLALPAVQRHLRVAAPAAASPAHPPAGR